VLRGHHLAEGETYHVYNRGAHKSALFTSSRDYDRFLLLLYLSNTEDPVHVGNLFFKYKGRSSLELLDEVDVILRTERLVDLLAYTLMPNHFHLVVRQKNKGGITQFMRKLSTAYSMYFNTRYRHSGVVFQGRFQSSCIDNEAYFRYIFAYTHLNPIDLIRPDWKTLGVRDKKEVRAFLEEYRYSSFIDYSVGARKETKLLAIEDAPDFLRKQNDLDDLLKWQRHAEISNEGRS
jgi:putative transposase